MLTSENESTFFQLFDCREANAVYDYIYLSFLKFFFLFLFGYLISRFSIFILYIMLQFANRISAEA